MSKKCTICGEKAKYNIKNTSDYYCLECAEEHFGDISMLVSVEEQAKRIKRLIQEANSDLNKLEDDMESTPDS